MKPVYYPELDETLYHETLENGLRVRIAQRKGFSKKMAYFVTDYGSIHTGFRLDGELDETLYHETLENGLRVRIAQRKGFSKKMAYFVTDYGSIHTGFRLDGAECQAPAGVAHYLEHKLFDMPGGRDVSEEFASLGASVNAFTSYDMTA